MQRLVYALPLLAVSVAGCGPGVYTRAELVYAEPAPYTYVVPVDRVVIVTREVLVSRGYVVYRIEEDGPNRIIWARHGDDEVVRVFATPSGQRVLLRGVREVRERDEEGEHENRGRHRGWARKGGAEDVMGDVDARLRREPH